MIITLDWPDASLSPNRKNGKHWTATSKAKDHYKLCAHSMTIQACYTYAPPTVPFRLVITFVPPDNRRRDLDNLLASIKPGIDGIAQALEIDDYVFEQITIKRGGKQKPGWVTIEFV